MGNNNSNSIEYNEPIGGNEEPNGETRIYRSPDYVKGLLKIDKNHTLLTNFKKFFKEFSDDEFLGERKKDSKGDLLNEFTFITYKEVNEKINLIGTNIIKKNLAPERKEYKNYNLKFIGIYSINTVNWYLTEMACCTQNITTIPINNALGEEALKFTINQTNLTTLFLSTQHFVNVIKNINDKNYNLENLVIMDSENFTEDMKSLITKNVKVIYFEELLEKTDLITWKDVKQDDIYTFSYTSGTTGEAKAVMITHKNMISFLESIKKKLDLGKEVYLSYLPLAHIMEKLVFYNIIRNGSKIAVFNGNILKWSEDIQIWKPTVFASVPRLFGKFYERIKSQFNELGFFQRMLVNYAVNRKIINLKKTGETKDKFFDEKIFNKIKEKFGGRIRLMITGSAPTDDELMNFIKVTFCCNLYEAYGQTEGWSEFITDHNEKFTEHVGGVFPNLEFKLVDIPEMNYTSKDKDEYGNPSPRGEIWARGESIFEGYYKNIEKTKESLTEDGWLKSGDVGQILFEGKRLKIIDRKKNIFKLSQGEYIAPEKLESAFKFNTFIDDIFIYGDSYKSYIVAIINIEIQTMEKLCKELKIDFNENKLNELKNNKLIIEKIYLILEEIHIEKKFNGIERVKKFHIEIKPFLQLNLITVSFKLKRNKMKEYYKKNIEDMYK